MSTKPKMDTEVAILATFGAVVFVPAIVVLTTFLRGYAITLYWRWFIVPTFVQAPHLSLSASIGVGMAGSLLAGTRITRKQEKVGLKSLFSELFSYYVMIYLIGYIIHLVIGG